SDRGSRAATVRFAVDGCRRPRARGLERIRFRALAAATGPARRSRRQSQETPISAGRRLPPDPPLRKQWLVRSTRRDDRRGAAGTLGYRSQILSWSAVPHRAQHVASLASAAAEAFIPQPPVWGIIALSETSSARALPQRRQRPRTSGAKRRVAVAARSAGMTRPSFPRSAWRNGKTCLRNSPTR